MQCFLLAALPFYVISWLIPIGQVNQHAVVGSGLSLDWFRTPPIPVPGFTAVQGVDVPSVYGLICNDSVARDFPSCSYYGLEVSATVVNLDRQVENMLRSCLTVC